MSRAIRTACTRLAIKTSRSERVRYSFIFGHHSFPIAGFGSIENTVEVALTISHETVFGISHQKMVHLLQDYAKIGEDCPNRSQSFSRMLGKPKGWEFRT